VRTLRLDPDRANATHTVLTGYMRVHTETTVRVVMAVFITVNVLLILFSNV
jgi:hypothetical protein